MIGGRFFLALYAFTRSDGYDHNQMALGFSFSGTPTSTKSLSVLCGFLGLRMSDAMSALGVLF